MNAQTKAVAQAAQTAVAITPMDMLKLAVEQGADLDKLEKLMELERRWKADRAREAYVVAMAAFRAEAIEIVKNKGVRYEGELKYRYATLADILAIVVPRLSAHGLSHRWETKQDGNVITVTCIVTHEQGHSESTCLSSPPDPSGGKNGIQAIGSTTAYLQRYTFMAIAGLAAKDGDDDGVGSEPPAVISADQATLIRDKIAEAKENAAVFLRWLKVEKVEEIRAKDYTRAVQHLDKKIAAKK